MERRTGALPLTSSPNPCTTETMFFTGILIGAAIGVTLTFAILRFLTHRQPKEAGLADRLPWALLVADGIILCKDSTFMAGFGIRGQDLSSAPVSALNAAADTVRQAIGLMEPGYSVEVNIHRVACPSYPPSRSAHFPTEELHAVDRERETHFTLPSGYYETRATLLINFTPPRESVQKVENIFVKGESASANYTSLLKGFQQAIDEIQGHLAPSFTLHQMNSTELVTECHQCLSGDPEQVVPDGGYLHYALASGDLYSGFTPRFRDQHLHMVTITGFGPSVRVASGDFFNSIRDAVRWHVRYLPLSRAEAESKIQWAQKNWFSQRKGLRAFMPGGGENEAALEDTHALAMQEETAAARAELASGESRFGFISNVVIIRDTDLRRGRSRADAIVQRAREAGFVAQIETTNATAAFMGSLPGFGAANLRRFLVSSRVVSHLFPTTQPWAGDEANPSALFPKNSPPLMMVGGRGSTPFRLHLHHGDVGHCLVVGATGAGKSVLVGSIMMSWLRYKESRIACFDVGRSHQQLTESADGQHINLGQDTSPPLQPLRHLDADTDLLWAESWVSGLCSLAKINLTPDERLGVGHALKLVAEEAPEHRTLTELSVSLPPRVAEVLSPYTSRGTFGRLFDGVEAAENSTTRMRTMELRDILSMGDTVIAPLLMCLFRKVERALDGTPTLIVIEEAWAALMRTEFSARLQQWLLTLRKQNAAVIIVAHNPLQIRELPNASIITDSCPTRILLPNPEARVEAHAAVYRFLDLNNREIDLIASAKQKQEYYYTSPRGSRMFDLCLGSQAKRILIPQKNQ